MNFIKKLISKQEHELSEEEKVRLNSILDGNHESESKDPKDVSKRDDDITELEKLVNSLNLGEVNKLRDLLDERERELYKAYGLDEKSTEAGFEENLRFEAPVRREDTTTQNIEDDISEEDLNDKTQEIEKIEELKNPQPKKKEKPKQPEQNARDETSEEMEYEEIKVKKSKEDKVVDKLKKVFGAENVFSKEGRSSKHQIYKDKDILMIGIRKFDADEKEESIHDQNAWFVSHIKKFDKLKDFKMITSKADEKELFCDNYEKPISINYKAMQLLKTKEEFDF